MNCDKMLSLSSSPVRRMRRLMLALGVLAALGVALPALAQQIPALLSIPPAVAAAHPELIQWRATLVAERDDLRTKTAGHNSRCSAVEEGSNNEVPCRDELADLSSALKAHIERSNQYNDAVSDAIDAIAKAEAVKAAKDVECKWGDQSADVVDLRCMGLDPDRPIAVDPHVVRGEQRVFSAQVDLTLFDDPDYIKAMEAEVRTGADRVETMEEAIQYFKRTQLKRPNDPVVRQALLLAETLLKGRMQERQDNKDQAVQQLYHGVAALMTGDMVTAGDSIKRAGELDPTNPNAADWSLAVTAMKAHFQGTDHVVKTVEQLVGNALTSEAWGNYSTEVDEMKVAKTLSHDDKYVDTILDHAQHLEQEFPVRSAMHPSAHTTQIPAQKSTVHN
jgi:hypothetical protein